MILLVLSCESDNEITPASGDDNGQFVATTNGELFSSDEMNVNARMQSNVLTIIAENDAGDTIAITITSYDGEDNYDLSGLTSVATAIYLPSGDTQFYSSANAGGSGIVSISNLDATEKEVSGTFNFTAIRQLASSSETVTIQNGSFTKVLVSGL